MKRKLHRPSDSGRSRLRLLVMIDILSYEYYAILSGEQSRLLQTNFVLPERLVLPKNSRILSKSWERLSRNSVGLELSLEITKGRTYRCCLLATLTKMPNNSSPTTSDSSESRSPSQQEKPPEQSQGQTDYYAAHFDLQDILNSFND